VNFNLCLFAERGPLSKDGFFCQDDLAILHLQVLKPIWDVFVTGGAHCFDVNDVGEPIPVYYNALQSKCGLSVRTESTDEWRDQVGRITPEKYVFMPIALGIENAATRVRAGA